MRRYGSLPLTVLVCGSVLVLAGCPTPSTWTTPRTIPEGTMSHTVGFEWYSYSGEDVTGDGDVNDPGDVPAFSMPFVVPAYLFRLGISDMMDFGAKVSTAGSLTADFKIQFLRSDLLDLAIDPSFQISIINYANLPLVFGINAGEAFQFFLGPRVGYAFFFSQQDIDAFDGGFWGGQAGFRIAAGDSFAILPTVDLLTPFDADVGFIITAGLGFNFGAGQPDYGGGDPAAAPPVIQ